MTIYCSSTDLLYIFHFSDPWKSSHPLTIFALQGVKHLESDTEESEEPEEGNPIVEGLIEYCEGFVEIQENRNEVSELNVKKQECQLMLTNYISEIDEVNKKKDSMANEVLEKQEAIKAIKKKIASLESDSDRLGVKIASAKDIKDAFSDQIADWRQELESCVQQSQRLVRKISLTAVSQLYLANFPQCMRCEALEIITEIICELDKSVLVDDLLTELLAIWTPWDDKHVIFSDEFPGCQEGLTKPLYVVIDPNDIIRYLLRKRKCLQIQYIFCYDDIKDLKQLINESREDVINILIPEIDLQYFAILSQMATQRVAIFICMRHPTSLPSTLAHLIDLSLTSEECPQMLIKMIEADKTQDDQEVKMSKKQIEISQAKTDLLQAVMSLNTNTEVSSEKVHQLTKVIREAKNEIKEIDEDKERELRMEDKTVDMSIPGAILSACVDMARMRKQCPLSLSQFVNVVNMEEQKFEKIFQCFAQWFKEDDVEVLKLLVALHLLKRRNELGKDIELIQFFNVFLQLEKVSNVQTMIGDDVKLLATESEVEGGPESTSRLDKEEKRDKLTDLGIEEPTGVDEDLQSLDDINEDEATKLKEVIDSEISKDETDDETAGESEDIKSEHEETDRSSGDEEVVAEIRPDWCPLVIWQVLSKSPWGKEVSLAEIMMNNEDHWQEWFRDQRDDWKINDANEDVVATHFILAVTFKYHNFNTIAHQFMERCFSFMTKWTTNGIDIREIATKASATESVIFLAKDCSEDPGAELEAFAPLYGLSASKLKFYSLSKSKGKSGLLSILETSGIRGQWLVLQNVDLDPKTLGFCGQFLESSKQLHSEFRLWITCNNCDLSDLPNSHLLQMSRVVDTRSREFLTMYLKESNESKKLAVLPLLIYFLKCLHRKLNLLDLNDCLFFDESSKIPANFIYRSIEENSEILPILSQNELTEPGKADQIFAYLRDFIYFPILGDQSEDMMQLQTDLWEILEAS